MPKVKVKNKLITETNQSLLRIEKCVHVIKTPEDNKIKVFNKGILKGLILSIPFGGHTLPSSESITKTKSK